MPGSARTEGQLGYRAPRTLAGDIRHLWGNLSPRVQTVAKFTGILTVASAGATIGLLAPSGTTSLPNVQHGLHNFEVVGKSYAATTPFPDGIVRRVIRGETAIGYAAPNEQDDTPGLTVPGQINMTDGVVVIPNQPAGSETVIPEVGPERIYPDQDLSAGEVAVIDLGGYAFTLAQSREGLTGTFGPASYIIPRAPDGN